MKLIFIFLFTAISLAHVAQVKSTATLIKEIDDSQFTIVHTDKASFTMNSKPAMKLIKKGHAASEKLIEALNDPTKTIMAHLILCHIYFKVVTFAGPKVITVNDEHVSNYFLGQKDGEGLVISEVKKDGVYKKYITPIALEKILLFWKNKTAKK